MFSEETEVKIIRQIELTEATLSLREDGIVLVFYHDNTVLDIPVQLKMADAFNEIADGIPSLFVFTAGEGVTITKEARDNALKLEDSTPIKASAVVADNLAYRIIANFFLKVQKPKGKYRVVANLEDAIKWLKSLD
ncbi:MAG: hypothetical protein KA163_11175 [Bacteroidia bacterium]|nr:hypothetical protein [Bacteroidia bacterium]